MPKVDYEDIAKEYRYRIRENPDKECLHVQESIAKGHCKPSDFDLGKLFQECFGESEFFSCRSGRQSMNRVMERHMTEAAGAVNTTMFQNISGQIIYSEVLRRYQEEEFVFSRLIPERPVTPGLLNGEKIAGITPTGPGMPIRPETEPYALAGVGENWIYSPPVLDRGRIVPVTWEAVFQDRTGQLLEEAGNQGYWAGVDKENRAIDCVIDENTTAHRYNWRNLGQIETYNDNTGNHTWDNLIATNALVDHTDIDGVEQGFNNMLDPFTGEPIVIDAVHLIAVKALELTARRILSSTEIVTHIGGYATTGNLGEFRQPNPYNGKYSLVTSRRLAVRLGTDTSWFMGDVTKYARYMVAEPINVVQAPSNNQDEFHRRIVAQFRVNERGQHVVVEPRAMVKSTA